MKQGSGISFDTELIYSRLMGLTSMRMLDLRTCSSINWRPSRHRCPQKMANCVLWRQKLYWKESFSVSRLLMLFSSHVWRSSIVAQFCGQYTGRVKELCKPYVEGFLRYVINKLRDSDIYLILRYQKQHQVNSHNKESYMAASTPSRNSTTSSKCSTDSDWKQISDDWCHNYVISL